MQALDVRTSRRVLADFEQDTACALGVHEEVQMTAGSGLDGGRYQCRPASLKLCPRSMDVIDVQRNMMKSGTALAQKASNGRFRTQRLQQLNSAFPERY